MQGFEEARKIYLDAKEQHEALLQEFDKRLAGKPLAEAWKHPNVRYRMSVRKIHAEIKASDEILTAARRKYARSIRADIESQPQLEAARNALLDIYWARVTAGIQVEFHALLQEYFKTPPQSKLFEARQEFKTRYGLD